MSTRWLQIAFTASYLVPCGRDPNQAALRKCPLPVTATNRQPKGQFEFEEPDASGQLVRDEPTTKRPIRIGRARRAGFISSKRDEIWICELALGALPPRPDERRKCAGPQRGPSIGGGAGNRTRVRKASSQPSFTCVVVTSLTTGSTNSVAGLASGVSRRTPPEAPTFTQP